MHVAIEDYYDPNELSNLVLRKGDVVEVLATWPDDESWLWGDCLISRGHIKWVMLLCKGLVMANANDGMCIIVRIDGAGCACAVTTAMCATCVRWALLPRVVICLGIVAKSGQLFGHCCQEWSTAMQT